jgi:putative endonuclease
VLWLTQLVARSLGNAARHFGKREPEHLTTARRGETEAYLYLRQQGYRIVAKNFRTPHNRGEIDLIGWDRGVLCFVEVKTHAQPGLVPPEVAVDADKKQHVRSVARRYVRRLRGNVASACRFDVVSVVLGDERGEPTIRLRKGAFSWRSSHHAGRDAIGQDYRRHWWRR